MILLIIRHNIVQPHTLFHKDKTYDALDQICELAAEIQRRHWQPRKAAEHIRQWNIHAPEIHTVKKEGDDGLAT